MFFRHDHRLQCFALAVAGFISVAPTVAAGEPAIDFPVVFTSPEALEQTGLSVRFATVTENGWDQPKPVFANTCFEINNEGGYYLSVSDEFLAHYKTKGFSLRSLCLALVSEARFDPETGRRLATIVLRDPKREQRLLEKEAGQIADWSDEALAEYIPRYYKNKAALKAAMLSAIEGYKRGRFNDVKPEGLPDNEGSITSDVPLDVPDCFKNATPYLDCTWRYGMTSGRRTRAGLQQRFKAYGEAFDRQMLDYFENGQSVESLAASMDSHPAQSGLYLAGSRYQGYFKSADGYFDGALYKGQPAAFAIPSALTELIDQTFFVVHPDFPHGYGYALHATGEKDSGASPTAIIATYDRRRHSSRFNPAKLVKTLVNWRQ